MQKFFVQQLVNMIVIAFAVLIPTTLVGEDQKPVTRVIHPRVFELVSCWASDTVEPVCTEINLDAVDKNRNQFDKDKIQFNGDWIVVPEENGILKTGFKSYKVLKQQGEHYTIEYLSNDGGTLTTRKQIEFVIEQRVITIDLKQRTCNVLKVLSIRDITQG